MDDLLKAVAGEDKGERVSPSQLAAEANLLHLLSDGDSAEHAARLLDIKSRIRRSLDDPRPSLPLSQVDVFIDALVAKARAADERA